MPVASTSDTFQTFSIPRFSWIITECRNAVPVSHGISAAFSTRVPSPVAAPAELGVRPARAQHDARSPRHSQAASANGRVVRIHSASSRRVTSAPIANANGTVNSV